jgi:hypothetical protein
MRFPLLWVPVLAVVLSACAGAAATPAAPASATDTATSAAPAGSPSVSSNAVATPTLTGPFTAAGIAHSIDHAATAVNPADFETTVPASAAAVYVVFALKPGTVGKVTLTMTMGGASVSDPLTIDYTLANTWGDFKMAFPSGDHSGDYVATITLESTGDSVTLAFTVG